MKPNTKARFVFGVAVGAGLAVFSVMPAHAELYSHAPSAAVSSSHAVSGPKIESHPKSWRRKVYMRVGVGHTWYSKWKSVGIEHEGTASYVAKKPKSGLIYSVGVGYKFADTIRSDLNFYFGKISYRQNNDEQKLMQNSKVRGVMLNGYYDFKRSDRFIPYMTAGVGVGKNKSGDLIRTALVGVTVGSDVEWKGKDKATVVWNIGGGVWVRLVKNISVDVGYRYANLGRIYIKDHDAASKGGGAQKVRGHQGLVSLIYSFS